MKVKQCLLALMLLLCAAIGSAQDRTTASLPASFDQVSDKLLSALDGNTTHMQQKLKACTQRFLQRIARRERKIRKQLYKTDSAAAQSLNIQSDSICNALNKQMQQGSGNGSDPFSNVYSSKLDSLKTAITFLEQNGAAGQSAALKQQYQQLLSKYNSLQDQFNQTATIDQYLNRRQEELNRYLSNSGGAVATYSKMQQDIFYYRQQIAEYKAIWEDPSKLEKQLTSLLCKIPQFKQFFNQYSDLGTVFQLANSTAQVPANGMQTRATINQFIQQNRGLGNNIQSQIQTSLPNPRDQLQAIKDRLASEVQSRGEDPQTNFKPNHQKTRSFLKRLEYGTSIQSVKANYFFPATTDIGLSVGYKLNDKSVIGIGSSGKIGWGSNINHIAVTGEGMSLRSFVDVKLKGSFWLSGGWEYNYQQPGIEDEQWKNSDNWKSSGLLGLTKTLALSSKGFKKYRIQLLYDFLHQQIPYTTPVKCRVGYSF